MESPESSGRAGLDPMKQKIPPDLSDGELMKCCINL